MKTKWLVWREGEEPDDGVKIDALDASDAAEEWAEADDSDSADYAIASQRSEPVVCVMAYPSGPIERFKVSGECVPRYTARELAPGPVDSSMVVRT